MQLQRHVANCWRPCTCAESVCSATTSGAFVKVCWMCFVRYAESRRLMKLCPDELLAKCYTKPTSLHQAAETFCSIREVSELGGRPLAPLSADCSMAGRGPFKAVCNVIPPVTSCRPGSSGSANAGRLLAFANSACPTFDFELRCEVVAMRSAPQLLAAWRWLRVHAACSAPGRSVRRPCRAVRRMLLRSRVCDGSVHSPRTGGCNFQLIPQRLPHGTGLTWANTHHGMQGVSKYALCGPGSPWPPSCSSARPPSTSTCTTCRSQRGLHCCT